MGVTVTQFHGRTHRFGTWKEYRDWLNRACDGEEAVHLQEQWDSEEEEAEFQADERLHLNEYCELQEAALEEVIRTGGYKD